MAIRLPIVGTLGDVNYGILTHISVSSSTFISYSRLKVLPLQVIYPAIIILLGATQQLSDSSITPVLPSQARDTSRALHADRLV